MDDHGESVVGDRNLDEADAGLGARLDLALGDRAGRVGDVGLVAAELEPAAGARRADRHPGSGVHLLEFLGNRFRDRRDGAGTVGRDHLRRAAGLPLPVDPPPPHAGTPRSTESATVREWGHARNES